MSFNFINNQSNIKKLNNTNTNISKTDLNFKKNVSIFSGQQSNNLKSASVFSNNDISAANFDSFSATKQKNMQDTNTGADNSFSFFGALKNFFAPETEKESLGTNAQSVLSKAQSLTSSQAAKKLLAENEEQENGQLSNTKNKSASSDNIKNDKNDKKEEKDYSQSSVSELEKAFKLGKPSNSEEAVQMLNNASISSEQIAKIKEKFQNDNEIQDLIGDLQADVN